MLEAKPTRHRPLHRGREAGLKGPPPGHSMVNPQHDDGADDCDNHAVKIEAGDAGSAEQVE